jgi:hypothetical protein
LQFVLTRIKYGPARYWAILFVFWFLVFGIWASRTHSAHTTWSLGTELYHICLVLSALGPPRPSHLFLLFWTLVLLPCHLKFCDYRYSLWNYYRVYLVDYHICGRIITIMHSLARFHDVHTHTHTHTHQWLNMCILRKYDLELKNIETQLLTIGQMSSTVSLAICRWRTAIMILWWCQWIRDQLQW